MKKLNHLSLWAFVAAAAMLTPSAQAQNKELEIGALGLISDYRAVTVSGPSGATAKAGPGLGFSGGFVLGQSMGNRWGGEFRYLYFRNDLELSSAGQEATLGAQSHAIHYDVLYYLSDPDARIRPYVAGGGGVKYFQGTGTEDPFQPLSNLALLTKTSQAKPMGDVGVGVKIRIGSRAVFRVEVRDYVTAVPDKVIAAAPGAKMSGVLHQIAPLFGITWTF
ncbi:MAG: outer membrane beta-barrel protein [Bryobacterales bacterium]|nr:outer membrane beta-barrel protein [Acidobacteriota bacterium]MCB9384448.1 outer membrane beta-barrel protein [Bryobacterales bacterium]